MGKFKNYKTFEKAVMQHCQVEKKDIVKCLSYGAAGRKESIEFPVIKSDCEFAFDIFDIEQKNGVNIIIVPEFEEVK